jgi:hypothetical protein
MCSASLAVASAGLLVNSAGQVAQGESAYQAGLLNQQWSERRRDLALKSGEIEKQRYLDEASKRAGQQAALFGVMGARMDEGTPSEVMAKQLDEINREAALIKWQAEVNAQQAVGQGYMAKYQGERQGYGSNVQATSSLLSGGARLLSGYLDKPSTTKD